MTRRMVVVVVVIAAVAASLVSTSVRSFLVALLPEVGRGAPAAASAASAATGRR